MEGEKTRMPSPELARGAMALRERGTGCSEVRDTAKHAVGVKLPTGRGPAKGLVPQIMGVPSLRCAYVYVCGCMEQRIRLGGGVPGVWGVWASGLAAAAAAGSPAYLAFFG